MTKTAPLSLRIDPKLKQTLQKLAARENRTLTNWIETRLVEMARQDGKQT